jgi:hypothetical protein
MFGANIIGGMAGGGVTAELIIMKAFTCAVVGGIVYCVAKAVQPR